MLVDSSKTPSHGFVLNEMSNVDLFVIHLVRDSRGVVYSWQRKKRRPEIYWKEEYMPRLSTLKAIREWILFNELTRALKRKVFRYKIVRYKTFAKKPKDTILKTMKWLNTKPSSLGFFIDDHHVELEPQHTISGNPIRFKQGLVEIHPDMEWMVKMPRIKKVLISLFTYPFLRRYK